MLRLRIEDLSRLMMVCPRTVSYWDRDKRPTKLHERIMERCIEEGTKDPNLHAWVNDALETSSPLDIVTHLLARARWPFLELRDPVSTDEDVAMLRGALASDPSLLTALERVLVRRR